MSDTQPYLTKSSYVRGVTCQRLLWLSWHQRLAYSEPESGSPAAVGIEIGEKAHELFPDGVLVAEAPWQHDAAVARTHDLMADPVTPAIFEAAFEYGGVRIRADVLERMPGGTWGLREVKSSTKMKARYVDDAAVQAYVIEQCGIALSSIELVHVDTTYAYEGGPIDWRRFFKRDDIQDKVRAETANVRRLLPEHLSILNQGDEPAIAPSPHCPANCDYWGHCTAAKPSDWMLHLPRLSQAKFDALSDARIERIRDIPESFPLTLHQDRMRDVIVSGRPYISRGLEDALAPLNGRTGYLDFEAMNPAVPVYAGTRPYQRIPFQWSLHTDDGTGQLEHSSFLAEGADDPREAFVVSLIGALEPAIDGVGSGRDPGRGGDGDWPIVVYSAYERGVLGELAALLPHYADALERIMARLVDLYVIVRDHVYLEAFNGSLSIKQVGKALAPQFSYDGLVDVVDGAAAARAFQQIVRGGLARDKADALRNELLVYCRLDTLAMVEAHRGLLLLSRRRPHDGW